MIDDSLRTVGIAQRGQTLFVIVDSRADGGDHDGLAVASKVVLQQPCQGAVAVGHERGLLLA